MNTARAAPAKAAHVFTMSGAAGNRIADNNGFPLFDIHLHHNNIHSYHLDVLSLIHEKTNVTLQLFFCHLNNNILLFVFELMGLYLYLYLKQQMIFFLFHQIP